MSTALLPPKLAGSPVVQKITGQLAGLRNQNRDLRQEAAFASSPIETSIATQAGVAAAAALTVYMPERAPTAMAVGGLLLLGYGALNGSPSAVHAANGMLSPLVFGKTVEVLTAQRAPVTATATPAASAAPKAASAAGA